MVILQLLSQEDYDVIREFQKTNPVLTYNAKGFDTIPNKLLQDSDRSAISVIIRILKKTIGGFREFQNFRLTKDGILQLRCRYNWTYGTDDLPFIGVGYFALEDLKTGNFENSFL